MDSILLRRSVLPWGSEFALNLSGNPISYDPIQGYGIKPYFFFKSELGVKNKSYIRHLIRYRNGYFDYITKKEYSTLKDWADDNNQLVNDILYGVNHVFDLYKDNPYVAYTTLDFLLNYLEPSWVSARTQIREPTISDDINEIIQKIRNLELEMMRLKERTERVTY